MGGQQFLQSALNRAVLCLCDCQVGHYSLIRALFPYVALIGLSMLLPLACCPNAIRPLFHCTAIFTAVISTQSPIGPQPTQPPALTPPSPPPTTLLQHPTSPFRFDEYPFTARRKGHAKLVVSIVNHPNSDWFQWNKWVVAAPKESKGPCGSSKLGDFLRGAKRSSLLSERVAHIPGSYCIWVSCVSS